MMTPNYSVRRQVDSGVGPVRQNREPGVLGRALLLVPARLASAWARHRDEKLLQTLSDHQLRDLGIGRGDIQRVVRGGRGW
jgi:uncharacterized protein YjiS (DUF1127 family)